jgi:hypothetical protein
VVPPLGCPSRQAPRSPDPGLPCSRRAPRLRPVVAAASDVAIHDAVGARGVNIMCDSARTARSWPAAGGGRRSSASTPSSVGTPCCPRSSARARPEGALRARRATARVMPRHCPSHAAPLPESCRATARVMPRHCPATHGPVPGPARIHCMHRFGASECSRTGGSVAAAPCRGVQSLHASRRGQAGSKGSAAAPGRSFGGPVPRGPCMRRLRRAAARGRAAARWDGRRGGAPAAPCQRRIT